MSSTAIRQQIIQSLANLSDEQLLQIRELIDQNFLLQKYEQNLSLKKS